ncbi:MAG: hypothetical protein LAN70_12010 [Acidobacteriia bacterium]|nr:hypothetical protein [Terriglobia bacterium]
MTHLTITGLLVVFAQAVPATAQTRGSIVQSQQAATVASTVHIGAGCAWISSNHPELAPLAQVCESAMSMRQTLPNFICEQETRRSQPVAVMNVGRPSYREAVDVVTAEVTYADGEERFGNIAVNGHPAASIPANFGMWSEGEFSPVVTSILHPMSSPELRYRGEQQMGSTPVLVYDYRIASGHNVSWAWRINGRESLPGYHGTLWVDKTTGQLRRLTRESSKDEVESWTHYVLVANDIRYDAVDIAELGKFFLPVRSELMSCERGMTFCNRNVLTFKNCRKFSAKARIITDAPEPR